MDRVNKYLALYLFGKMDDIAPIDRGPVEYSNVLEQFDKLTEEELEILFEEWWGPEWSEMFDDINAEQPVPVT